jgi:L-fucono-1,5-lactonase
LHAAASCISEPEMRLDSHQHFWRYKPDEHTWMSAQMDSLKRDFLPNDLAPLLSSLGFDGCVAVQARQCLEETRWLLELAEEHDFIAGVVGWVDLRSDRLAQQLQRFATHSKFSGVRHVVHDETDHAFMLQPAFRRGIAQLRDFNLTYDLLLFPKHLPVAIELAREFPEQPFVLDHIAKPLIKEGGLSPWRDDLCELASFPNIYCKLSGMVTEAEWGRWNPEIFQPYLDVVFDAFGPSRLMIGSDWPVCTLSADYSVTMCLVLSYLQQFSSEIQSAILGDNCARFYRIE